MGITTDGERAKKRLWFAEKKLRQAKELDVPVLGTALDGFRIRVHQDRDIEGGRITSPMGAMVLCTGPDAGFNNFTRAFTADNWEGAFNYNGKVNILHHSTGGISTYFLKGYTQEELEVAGFSAIESVPVTLSDPYTIPNPSPPPATIEEYFPESMPFPVVMPFKGAEAYWICHCGYLWTEDIDSDGVPDANETQHKFEAFLNFYAANGSSMNNRVSLFQVVIESDTAMRIFQMLPATGLGFVYHRTFTGYETSSNKRRLATYYLIDDNQDFTSSNWFMDEMAVDLPAALQTAITTVPNATTAKPLGSYAFAPVKDGNPTLLHCVDLTNTKLSNPGAPEEAYFLTGDEAWRLFYIMNTKPDLGIANVHTVNADIILPILDTLQGGGIGTNPATCNWSLARRMMYQLFPNPNHNYETPIDAEMFHDKDGNVYTWSRTYGAVKFAHTALTIVSLALPAEVTGTDWVKPSLSYCGENTVGDNLYLCVCENKKFPAEVLKVYYGSPLPLEGGWTALPDPSSGYHLVHVRPVMVEFNSEGKIDIILLGVLEDENPLDPGYFFAILKYIDGTGAWQKLGKMPVDVGDYFTWSVGLFGEGAMANMMKDFLDPPDVLPQMPLGPDNYSELGQP